MKSFVILTMIAFCAINGMKAQEATPAKQDIASAKKMINEIKFSERTFYTELPPMMTNPDNDIVASQQKAKEVLKNFVVSELSKSKTMTPEEKQGVKDLVESKCQDVVIQNEDYIRIFTYIEKCELGIDCPRLKLDGRLTSIVQTKVAAEPKPAPKDTISAPELEQENVEAEVAEVIPVVESEKEEIKEEVEIPLSTEEEGIPAICETIIAKKTFGQLMSYLKLAKLEQKLMYGNYAKMLNPEKCYVAVVDKTSRMIVAVLGKGEGERMNFITQKMDHCDNYVGGKYAVLFIQEY